MTRTRRPGLFLQPLIRTRHLRWTLFAVAAHLRFLSFTVPVRVSLVLHASLSSTTSNETTFFAICSLRTSSFSKNGSFRSLSAFWPRALPFRLSTMPDDETHPLTRRCEHRTKALLFFLVRDILCAQHPESAPRGSSSSCASDLTSGFFTDLLRLRAKPAELVLNREEEAPAFL